MNIDVKHPDRPAFERDPRPIVAAPRRGASAALFAALAVIAAILLFVALDAQRRRVPSLSQVDRLPAVYAPPPPLSIPVETAVQPQLVPVIAVQPVAVRPAPPPPPQYQQQPMRPMPPPVQYIRQVPEPYRPIPNPQIQFQSVTASPALIIDSGGGDLAIGTLIPAVLETPIDTSRPGQVRAIVSRDARSQDGQKILVPRGSRLVGEYQSDVRPGQNRVLVNWTRLIRPDGAAVRLGIPSADLMGEAGIPGNYHSFFLARFFNAALQTAFSVGGNLVGGGANNTVIVGLPGQLSAVAGQGLFSADSHRPKITVKPGTLFNIFVARELDFSGATSAQ